MVSQLTMIKNKSISYNQNQLKNISDNICDNIENILSYFDITDYRLCDRMLTTSCPIHGGDNSSALNLYHTGDSYRGNWKCRTHQCEKIFKASVIGFIRGILSHKKYNWSKDGDKMVSFQETMMVVEKILGGKSIDVSGTTSASIIEKQKFTNSVKYLSQQNANSKKKENLVSRHTVRKLLDIPSRYFMSRGYSKETLLFFDIGECTNPGKEMYNRAVVPIYDIDGKHAVGCSGRSIYEKCNKCANRHNPDQVCCEKNIPKWKHSLGFRSEENLYNISNAKQEIEKTKTVIIVESPGNVWRLHEAGICNSVAIFGSSFSDKQKMILDISGAMRIITLMDNDEAGEKAAAAIEKKCSRTYIVKHIKLKNILSGKFSDIGEMTTDQVIEFIKPQIGEII